MSKIDEKYIKALDSFTGALEEIVELLKSQQKSKKSDTVNEMLKGVPDSLQKVVKDLKKVTQKGFKDLKEDNQKILKKIDSIKQQKESGMFDKVEDPKNKNKIVDGIKVVVLIAAGVLALGLAFKIIGKVDFLSVVALSVAMVSIAFAFQKMSETKGLTYSKVFMISAIMPIMALGLMLAGKILKSFPIFGFFQSISLILVGTGLGLASYFLLKSLGKVNIKRDWATIIALPIMLPLIATGLLLSGLLLKDFPIFGLFQSLSLILVGAALGITAYLLFMSLGKIDIKKNWSTILLLPMMLPLIALGIVLSSIIFQDFLPIKHPLDLLIGSLVTGLAILFFVPSVYIIGKMNPKDILMGVLGVIAVAGAILAVSWIFTFLPDKMIYPEFMWSLGSGLSLLIFGLLSVGVGFLAANPATAAFFWVGVLAVMAVAGSIVGVSHILSSGKYKIFPSLDWALGVGTALLLFSIATVAASAAGLFDLIGRLFTGGENPLVSLARIMVQISWILTTGKYQIFPSKEYINNFAFLMLEMDRIVNSITSYSLFRDFISFAFNTTNSIMVTSLILDVGKYTNYPTNEYIDMFSYFIIKMGYTVKESNLNITDSVTFRSSTAFLAPAFGQWIKTISEGDYTKVPSYSYTNRFSYFILSTGLVVKFWLPSIKDSSDFLYSTKLVVPAFKMFLTIPTVDNSFFDSMNIMRKSMIQLSIAIDLFLYERGLFGSRRSLVDFRDFNYGLRLVVGGLNELSQVKPVPVDFLNGFDKFLNFLDKFPKKSLFFMDKYDNIKEMAKSVNLLADSFNKLNSSMASFLNMSRGLFLISIIDEVKLGNVLSSIQKHQSALRIVYKVPEEQANLLSIIKSLYETLPGTGKEATQNKEIATKIEEKSNDKKKQDQFYSDISEIKTLLYQFLDYVDKPEQAPSFHK